MEIGGEQFIIVVLLCLQTFRTSSNVLPFDLREFSEDVIYQNQSSFIFIYCNVYCDGGVKKTVTVMKFKRSPRCMHCYCDEYCEEFGDCCPDIDGKIKTRLPDDSRHICFWDNADVHVTKIKLGVAMLMTCPDAENKTGAINEEQMYKLSPVTSTLTNLSYYNEYIAKCNGETSYVYWHEDEETYSGYGSEYEAGDDSDLISGNYQFTYDSENSTSPRLCDPIVYSESVDQCNTTGQWSARDENMASLCHDTYYPVQSAGVVYRNIFCYLCNGLPLLFRKQVFSETDKLSSRVSIVANFPRITLITRFKKWPQNPAYQRSPCKINKIWDPIKEVCRKLYCSKHRKLKDKECIPKGGNADYTYSFNIVLKPLDRRTSRTLEAWELVTNMMISTLQIIMNELDSTNYVYTLTVSDDSILRLSCKLLILENTQRVDTEEKLFSLVFSNWEIDFRDQRYLFEPSDTVINDERDARKATYRSDPVSGTCCSTESSSFDPNPLNKTIIPETVEITRHFLCPYVKLDAADFTLSTTDWIDLDYANVSLPAKYVSFLPDGEIGVCVETLLAAYNGSELSEVSAEMDAVLVVQNTLSFVCVTVSLVCLVCTFVTYCTFSSLRSLPAKNNMFLTAYLFLAQLVFQFGFGQTQNKTLCVILGVIIHCLWMNVILWMNVCSFHMYRVFVLNPAHHTQTSRPKYVLRYVIYTTVTSFAVSGVTIGTSLILSEGNETGYGGETCYLATPAIIGYVFVLPLSLVLCSNIIFFALTVHSISNVRKVKKLAGRERRNIYVYMKLSVLTGMFWTVSVLSEILDVEALSYVAIVLNGSQGLFLFVCYAMNRRVLLLWKELFSDVIKKYFSGSKANATEVTSV